MQSPTQLLLILLAATRLLTPSTALADSTSLTALANFRVLAGTYLQRISAYTLREQVRGQFAAIRNLPHARACRNGEDEFYPGYACAIWSGELEGFERDQASERFMAQLELQARESAVSLALQRYPSATESIPLYEALEGLKAEFTQAEQLVARALDNYRSRSDRQCASRETTARQLDCIEHDLIGFLSSSTFQALVDGQQLRIGRYMRTRVLPLFGIR